MIKYLQHPAIDIEKWDHCIDSAINGIIYPYSYYLDQVSPYWDALVLNDYEAVMPLPAKAKFGINYLIQPIFVQQLGVFSKDPISEDLLNHFLEAIPARFCYVNISLNTFNPISQKIKWSLNQLRTFELDLISSYEQLRSKYSKQTIRNIKKAEKEHIYITKNADPLPIIESFKNNRGKNISILGTSEYETLKHLIYSGIYRGNTEIYSAYTAQNNYCAGVIFLTSHKKTILIFSGSTAEARTNGAMSALIDQYIKEHALQNITLDFEGSNNKNLARFYAGFGSKECVFLQIEKQNFPFILKPLILFYFFLKNKRKKR